MIRDEVKVIHLHSAKKSSSIADDFLFLLIASLSSSSRLSCKICFQLSGGGGRSRSEKNTNYSKCEWFFDAN